MKKNFYIFLTAVMFYTRIPCPKWITHDPLYITLATRYFPLIGWIVGGAYAGMILLSSWVFPELISVVLGLVCSILLTGAFHEDGFADTCDGFGGGWTSEKILTIMKDSRIGTYGATGLILIFTLKILSTVALFQMYTPLPFVLLIISSHSLSRMMAATIIYSQPYARYTEDSKVKPVAHGIRISDLLVAILFGIVPFIGFVITTNRLFLVSLIPMIVATFWLSNYFKKWIGGYTGDCLGATQQVNEVIFLLSILALWKFI